MTAPRSPRAALLLALLAACAPATPPIPAPEQIPLPDPAAVDHVLFLVGDAGEATAATHPVLRRLRQDVEWWAEQLPSDSAVTVLFLGDDVYPLGMNAPGTEAFPHDSVVVMGQVEAVAGPAAMRRHARGLFLAGNHDWGLEDEWAGFVRVRTLADFLDRARGRTGARVRFVPEVGTGGPHVLDLGRHLRLVILDSAWWLLDGGRLTRGSHAQVLADTETALRGAGGRRVVLAAHHPFRSAGPHGGEFDFWETIGLRYLLTRSGAILQDVTSIPYRELEAGLRAIFARTGTPSVFVGGHEHSLQIIAAMQATDPAFSLVSGAASKLAGVGYEEGIHFGRSAPGYMRLLVGRDGGLSVFVEAAPERFLACPGEDPERAACMAEGVSSFATVHSERIR